MEFAKVYIIFIINKNNATHFHLKNVVYWAMNDSIKLQVRNINLMMCKDALYI